MSEKQRGTLSLIWELDLLPQIAIFIVHKSEYAI